MRWAAAQATSAYPSERDVILKLFGKQNLEIQIEGLQKKLDGLESQLAKAKLEHQKQEASAAKALTDAAQENERLVLELKQAQEEFKKAASDKKQLEASVAKTKDDGAAQTKQVIELKQEIKQHLQALDAAKADTSHAQQAKLEIDALQVRTLSELEQLKKEAAQQAQQQAAKLKEVEDENELLLTQLMTVQEELEKIFLDKKQLEISTAEAIAKAQNDAAVAVEQHQQSTKKLDAEVAQHKKRLEQVQQAQQATELAAAKQKAELAAELATAKAEMDQLKQGLAQATQNIAQEQSAKQAAESALAEIKAKSPAQLKAVTDKYQQQAQATLDLEAELVKQKSEHEATKAQLTKLDQDLAQALHSLAQEQGAKQAAEAALADIKAKSPAEIKALTDKYQHLTDQQAAKLKDTSQENELLLTQLMQVQEELESYYLDKTKFEKLYQDIQTRWSRLEKRFPNYADFGSLEMVTFDNLSDVPSVTWRVKDCVQGGVAFDEFLFQTVLQDGQPGIALVSDAKALASPDSALVPKQLKPQSKQLERFVRMGQTEFRQIRAAATIFMQLEVSGWRAVDLPKNFDLGFWRPSLKLLPAQLQALPMLLRYDSVKLKRELINPDYEHLWLEFNGLGLGARTWPKFEMRLGAAMVQRDGFSEFPKFEFPLIDGKTKPFDSWYAESQDDNGAKLELRFALEKKMFDTSVWGKLEDADKALLLRLIYVMPDVLLRLEAENTSIHRPWATWVGFAKEALKVIDASRVAAQPKQLPAPTPQTASTAPVLTPPAQLPAPTVQKSTPNKKLPTKVTAKKVAAKKAAAKKAASKKVPVIKHTTQKTVAPKLTAKTKPAAQKAVGKPATAKKTKATPKAAPAKKIAASKPMAKQPMVKKPATKTPAAAKRTAVLPAVKKKPVRKK